MAFDGKRPTVVKFPEMPDMPKVPIGRIRAVLVVVVILVLAFTSIFTVDPEEEALILRFGKYQRTLGPGLHFKFPLGIEKMLKVAVQRQLKQEFGFRTIQAGVRSQFTNTGYQGESHMLTGDLNAAVVEWVVQYRVVDSRKFLFRVRRVEDTFGDMSEAIMRTVVGDRTVNEVLTVGRQEIEVLVKEQLQELAEQYETGIRVDQVVLQNVTPPDKVRPSFNEVNQAEQERERLINEAQSEYNKVVPRAEGEARQTIQQAEGYAINRVNRSEGDAARFEQLLKAYLRAPEVTRTRIYLETMETILPRAGKKIVVDDDIEGLLPLLDLSGRTAPAPSAAGGDG